MNVLHIVLQHHVSGTAPLEEGDLASWRSALAARGPAGWGWALRADGARSLVFAWPESGQAELERLCRATLERRAGRVSLASVGDSREFRVGPDLPARALRRRGGYVWVAGSARELADAPQPAPDPELLRWARVDLDAARAEAPPWQKVEGPADPDRIRPFSDRVLGLLGWMPKTRALSLERRRSAGGWSERVVLGSPAR